MKAVRYYGQQDIRIEDIPEPDLRPGTVQIEPAWTGICGSDLHLYLEGPIPPAPTEQHAHPLSEETLPITFGHEFSGVVVEVGDGVSSVAVRDRVVVVPLMVCGQCAPCRDGRYNLCVKMGFIGISGGGGGLAERIVVEQRFVHPVGDLPLDEAALIEPLAVAAHAVRLSGAGEGDMALVGGAGPIGLLTAAVLHAMGVTAIVSEPSRARRSKATESGIAAAVVGPSTEDVVKVVRDMSGGVGADVAYECAGAAVVLETLMDALKAGGVLQVEALYATSPEFPMEALVLKEIQVRCAIGYAGDHARVIQLVNDGTIDLKPFITGRIAVEDIVEQGFRALVENKEDNVKILVQL